MKKRFISAIVIGLALSGTSAFAESSDVVVPVLSTPSFVGPVTERSEVIGAKSLTRIKARGLQLIKERVNSLKQNATLIAKSKDLTSEQKMAFTAFFNGKIADINNLGTKISQSGEASSTKVLVESIFTDYRIYGVVIPQVRLQKRIYEVQNHIVKLSDTFTKVQLNIDTQKAKGKDVTIWQKSLDDAKTLVATDTVKLSALMTQINDIKPSDYGTTSKATIESVNSGIKNIVKDINSISKKVRKPVYLKSFVSTSTQVTATSTH